MAENGTVLSYNLDSTDLTWVSDIHCEQVYMYSRPWYAPTFVTAFASLQVALKMECRFIVNGL